jgi:hypothetical protein
MEQSQFKDFFFNSQLIKSGLSDRIQICKKFHDFKINLNDLRSNFNEKTRIKFVNKRKTLTFN